MPLQVEFCVDIGTIKVYQSTLSLFDLLNNLIYPHRIANLFGSGYSLENFFVHWSRKSLEYTGVFGSQFKLRGIPHNSESTRTPEIKMNGPSTCGKTNTRIDQALGKKCIR